MNAGALAANEPIKIAFVIGQLGVGGGERQLYLLLKHLDRSRFDPLVITFNPGRHDYFEEKFAELGVRVCGVARSWNKASRLLSFSRLLRSERADIVHAWDLHLTPLAALAGLIASVPVRLGSVRCDPTRATGAWYRFAKGAGLHSTLANSSVGKAKLEELGVPSERIRVLFNGVELDGARSDATARADLRDAWRVPRDAVLLASVGRLNKGKNHALLIEALAALRGAYPGLHLVLFGDGPEREALESACARHELSNRVHFAGLVTDAARVLHAADVFCLSSDAEGMPNVLLEAAAAGLPLVTTDVGGARDIIVDGENGCIVPVRNVQAMARAIASVAGDPARRARMAAASRCRVEQRFTIEAAVAALQNFYGGFVSASHVSPVHEPSTHSAAEIQKHFQDAERYLAKDFDIRVRAILVREMLRDVSGQDVLDVGCGDGRLSLQFAAEARGVTLLDFSTAMLDRARQQCPPEIKDKVRFVLEDFGAARWSAPFDVVLCVGVLAHVRSIPDTMAGLSCALRPGGRLVLQISDNDVALTRLQHGLSTMRNLATRRATRENRTSLRDVLAEAARCRLEVQEVRSYSLMFPGLGRLPNQMLFKYQLASARHAALQRLCSDRLVLLTKH